MSEIKAVVFDMDGVLIDARDWHFEALNEALDYFDASISLDEHLSEFDGLPTREKLRKLTELGRLPLHVHDIVELVKQDRTLRIASAKLYPNISHQILLSWLKDQGYKIGVATNSIKMTTDHMLNLARVSEFIDLVLTNQDVKFSKPHPEIYEKIAKELGIHPSQMLVIEDSPYGVRAARDSGARVVEVANPGEVNLKLISQKLKDLANND